MRQLVNERISELVNNSRRCLGLLLFNLLTISQVSQAQNFPIQATVSVAPPYTNVFSEYLTGQKINLMLTGKGDVRITGYLKGSTGLSLVLPAAFSHYASRGGVHPITINGPKKISSFDLQESFNSLNVVDNSSGVPHKDLIGNYKLPEGDYELCITVYDAAGDVQLADKACAYFTVSNLEAPFLLTPADKDVVANVGAIFQPMQFQWTFPAGGNPARIVYELQIAELRAGQNAYNVFESGPLFARIAVTNSSPVYLTKVTDPRFEVGRQYAWRVQATGKDPNRDSFEFQNKGMSQVFSFTYGEEKSAAPQANIAKAPAGPVFKPEDVPIQCGCKFPVFDNRTARTTELTVGESVMMGGAGGYQLNIATVKAGAKGYDGTGTVAMAPNLRPGDRSGGGFIPIKVSFAGLVVNTDNFMLGGKVVSIKRQDGIGFAPSAANDSAIPDPTQLAKLGDDWATIKGKIEQEANAQIDKQLNGAGFETPFGFSSSIFTLAIDNLAFTATTAQYDAMTVFEEKSAFGAPVKISFGIKGACMPSLPNCDNIALYLTKDITIENIGLTFRGGADKANATHVVYALGGPNAGLKAVNIVADLVIPGAKSVKDNSPVRAILRTSTADGFSNWMAKAAVSSKFKIDGVDDFEFDLAEATYDHDAAHNPDGLPALVTALAKNLNPGQIQALEGLKTTDWMGFYMPRLSVTLPAVFSTDQKARPTVDMTNVIIDSHHGLTGSLSAGSAQNPIIKYEDGSLDGWYFSLDNIGVTFFDGSFVTANADGKIGLPITGKDKNAALAYTNTLSVNPDDKKINYLFKIQPTENLNIPIWKATMTIDKSSVIVVDIKPDQTVLARADLTGNISFRADLGALDPDFKIDLVNVQHLVVQSKEPYFSMDRLESEAYDKSKAFADKAASFVNALSDFVGAFASPPKDVAGSPFTITGFKPVMRGIGTPTIKAGFYFEGNLDLAKIPIKPKATVGLSILANVKLTGGRPDFSFGGIELGKVAVSGKLEVVTVNGLLEFMRDDPAFGNGFKGNLDVTVGEKKGKTLVKITGQAMFGHKDFDYYYLHLALSTGKAGVPIGPLVINGLGGGFYHNMTPPVPSLTQFADLKPTTTPYEYVPKLNSTGLKASVYFSLANKTLFTGNAMLEASIADGGLDLVRLTGQGKLITDGNAGLVQVNVDAQYHVPQQVFTLNADVNADVKDVLTAKGQLNVLVDFAQEKFYLKIGDPTNRIRIELKPSIAASTGYFVVGNTGIPPIPAPSPDIMSPETMANFRSAGYGGFGAVREMPGFEESAGLAFGATTRMGIPDIDFLIFWAKFHVGAGFDVNLKQLGGAVCEESGSAIGVNGWYATGQAYFELIGGVGVHCFLGDIAIVQLKAAALLGAGLPNPTWFQGFVTGEGTFMGASLGFTLPVKIGASCTIKGNPFQQKIIADITPKKDEKSVDIMTYPEVLLNYPRQFYLSYQDRDGNQKSHFYDLRPFAKLNGQDLPANQFAFPGPKTIVWNKQESFDAPRQAVSFTFGITVHEDGNVFRDPKSNQVVRQDTTVNFTTGECRAAFKPGDIAFTFPFVGQKYFLPGESKQGILVTTQTVKCLTTEPGFRYAVLFKPQPNRMFRQDLGAINQVAGSSALSRALGGGGGSAAAGGIFLAPNAIAASSPAAPAPVLILTGADVVRVPATINGAQFTFALPNLSLQTGYDVQLIREPIPGQGYTMRLTSVNMQNLYVNSAVAQAQLNLSGSMRTMAVNQVNDALVKTNVSTNLTTLRDATVKGAEVLANSTVLYGFSFNTSRYNTLSQKLNSLPAFVYTTLEADNTVTTNYAGPEGFDAFDVQPVDTHQYQDGQAGTRQLAPLVQVSETDNRWIDRAIGITRRPQWEAVRQALSGAGVLRAETPRENQSWTEYYDVDITNRNNPTGYGQASNTSLKYTVTRMSDEIDNRVQTIKENCQLLFARATAFAQELRERYNRDGGSYNNIRGDLERKYAAWGGRMVGYIGENRDQYGQDLRTKVLALKDWDARRSLCTSLPVTPTLNFTYGDPLGGGQSRGLTKTYWLTTCR